MRWKALSLIACLTLSACEVGNDNRVECSVSGTCPRGTACRGGYCDPMDGGAVEAQAPDGARPETPRSDAGPADAARPRPDGK